MNTKDSPFNPNIFPLPEPISPLIKGIPEPDYIPAPPPTPPPLAPEPTQPLQQPQQSSNK